MEDNKPVDAADETQTPGEGEDSTTTPAAPAEGEPETPAV